MTKLPSSQRLDRRAWLLVLGCAACLSGCFRAAEVISANGDGGVDPDQAGSGGRGSSTGGPSSASIGPNRPPLDRNACARGGLCQEVVVESIDKVDLLFVVDDSEGMEEEQLALGAQFPRLLHQLSTGDHEGESFPAAKDIHLAVVSSDLGLVGIPGVTSCDGFGDDGILQSEPRQPGCKESYPPFLQYISSLESTAEVAADFSCIARLGTGGCGFEQPLESALKALWPRSDDRITFLGDEDGFGTRGRGEDTSAGFLRSDPLLGLSVLAVVVVTDEDDCSVTDPSAFRPRDVILDAGEPADVRPSEQGAGVRCVLDRDHLFSPMRYVNGLQALREGREDLVVFAAIAGVPPGLVDRSALAGVDFASAAGRAELYARIEGDDAMVPRVDKRGTPDDPSDDVVRPACSGPHGSAAPANRLVEVAKGLGANGIVQSICEDDYAPAIDAIADRIAPHLGAPCLTDMILRTRDGLTACDVYWELPPPAAAPPGTPTECEEPGFDFLLPLSASARGRTDAGGTRCKVAQLAIEQDSRRALVPVPTETAGTRFTEGWYYDDFSEDDERQCETAPRARIAFTPSAKPPTGVRVVLDCGASATGG